MFYFISKLITLFIWPSNVISLLLVGGTALLLLARGPRLAAWGKRGVVAGVMLLVACGFGPVGTWLIIPLENRFPVQPLPADVAGVIMLGGFESPGISRSRQTLAINDAGERLTEGIRAAMLRPSARVIFTGGEARLAGSREGAVTAMRQYLQDIGIASERIVLEGLSRTTYENAILLKAMIKPKPGERFLLVTSAHHMPRSVGTFRQAGFEVIAWPVDYRTSGRMDLIRVGSSAHQGLERLDLAFKEWVGLVAYRLTGRTDALWPGPEPATAAGPAPAAAVLPHR